MPVQFLSQADHDRLNRFPEEITHEDLNSFFWLSHIDENLSRTRLSWLQRTPTGDNPKQILETLDKIAFLHQHNVNQWNLSGLNPNRINHLAKIGARATNQYLQRANEAKRYPILLTFLKQSLYNFTDDLIEMATSAELSYQHLNWCNTWYIRDDTLREANTALINYHYRLSLSQLWGGGMLSSSDGQRFPVKGSVRQGRALPRYFGYGKGITFYSWTSDQFSQYGSKAVPTTVRDATYVLDEILNNETELPILEHTTDTAGYTELIFALFDLLGLQFSPRIRDLADQQLYRTSSVNLEKYPNLKSHLPGVINTERILKHWDEMLRLAGSLKMGWVTASLIVQKLQAFPRQHPLTRALQEYGRLIKTIHILRWYAEKTHRRRLNRQINKGEALHSLRSHLCYANQGEIREQQDEQLHNQVGCLNLVTNAVIVWNTVYIEKVVQQLKKEEQFPGDEELKHIWPTRHAHINVYGRYHFNRDNVGKKQQLRELRQPGFQP
jgi:TnpA family transposase